MVHKNIKSKDCSILKREVSYISNIAISKKFNTSHEKNSNGYKMFKKAITILKKHEYEISFDKEQDCFIMIKKGNLKNFFN
jgi:hypothetical protein